jgi:hypothetical protein
MAGRPQEKTAQKHEETGNSTGFRGKTKLGRSDRGNPGLGRNSRSEREQFRSRRFAKDAFVRKG